MSWLAKHMICLQASGLQTMICLQADQRGLLGLQTYDVFASMWLTKISYVHEPCKMMPFLFIGATGMRLAGNKEGNGKGGKGNGDNNKGVRQGTTMATKGAKVTVTRVTREEESKVGKGDGNNDEVTGNK
jgi:hypothetical protein